jgi:hypothetical protein
VAEAQTTAAELDRIPIGMTDREVDRIAKASFRFDRVRIPPEDIPLQCRAAVKDAFAYYRKPPKRSDYLFLDQNGRLICRGSGLMFASVD